MLSGHRGQKRASDHLGQEGKSAVSHPVGAENLDPLQEQPMLLTTELSLQYLVSLFFRIP